MVASKTKCDTAQQDVTTDEIVYTEEELENYIPVESDSSYFQKAQDFTHLMKSLRIVYLNLKPKKITGEDGSIRRVFVADKTRIPGINKKGVEFTIRFLESKLHKHSVLTDWKEERMFEVMMDDMITWYWIMVENLEEYQASFAILNEMRVLINDELEVTYRRAIGNKERQGMIPASKELLRQLGLGKDDQRQNMEDASYPLNDVDVLRRQPNQQPGEY
jgi:hypothetical protein